MLRELRPDRTVTAISAAIVAARAAAAAAQIHAGIIVRPVPGRKSHPHYRGQEWPASNHGRSWHHGQTDRTTRGAMMISGVIPVAPTTFDDDENLDLPSQARVTDFPHGPEAR